MECSKKKHRGMGIHSPTRTDSPRKGCTERFTVCHDACPKDARGEYGYKAWTAEIELLKKERQKHWRLSTGKFRY